MNAPESQKGADYFMNQDNRQYQKMTETPIPKLIISLGIPTTISMLITNIYNMADSYFVSQVSLSAGGATSIVFGIMSILQAFGFMFGHGAGSNISRMLGSKHVEKASRYAATGFYWSLFSGFIIMIGGLTFLESLMRLLGSTETILPYAKDYGRWILLAAPAMTASCVLNNILRYEGKATLAMIGLTTGGILNMAFDPLFIFRFHMGISGAGFATALSQYISFGILLSMFLRNKTQSKLSVRFFARESKILDNIVKTGLPSLARQGLNSVSTMVLNAQAKLFGDTVIAAMGYVSRTSSLIFSVGLGIGQGFQPVAAFNYGAKKYDRVKKGTLFTLGFGVLLIGLISAGCFAFAPQIIGLFRKEPEVLRIGSGALRIMCVFLLFLPVSVVATMLFQSIGKSLPALVLSCLQSGLVFIPLCFALSNLIGVKGIELAQPLAYFMAAMVALPVMLAFLKRLPKEEQRKNIRVVVAIIRSRNENGEVTIFATRRGYGEWKGNWEFPGGKIEQGETPQEALVREIKEELDTEIRVGDLFDTVEYDYPNFHLSMDCFWAKILSGEPALKEHEAAEWLTKDTIRSVEWLPADLGLVEKIAGSME